MVKTPSTRIVIDASVAGRAGRIERSHPAGRRCREFLEAVRMICHRLVMTPEISQEWANHQASFARKWRVRMAARRKTDSLEVARNPSLLRKLKKVAASNEQREEMLKDWPLIEAAMVADGRIASLDERARKLFAGACQLVAELRRIVWVNPERSDEDALGWLERGAKLEQDRMLGRKG